MSEWVTLAQIVNARGNRGEVAAIGLASGLERFQELREVFLFGPDGPLDDGRPFEIEEAWEHKGRVILKFRGVDDISGAERFKGVEVRLPLQQRAPAEEGAYYHSDLTGCAIVDRATGAEIGKVAAFVEQAGGGILSVDTPDGRELLVPFARAICVEIDTAAKRIAVDLPEGLTDLNG